MPDLSCLSNEEQAQFYDTVEHELTVAVRDLVDTIARMDHVQNASQEHFTMPMDCLYELSGLVSQAIQNHTEQVWPTQVPTQYESVDPKQMDQGDQGKLETLYALKKIKDNYYAK
tara:strand:- start:1238 stop:1582 length:345 start_codon:yes stop_codon:yes gene_type:complete